LNEDTPILPNAVDCERELIAQAVMGPNSVTQKAVELGLLRSEFYNRDLGRIFGAGVAVSERGELVQSMPALLDQLRRDDCLELVKSELSRLPMSHGVSDLGWLVGQIKKTATLRRARHAIELLAQRIDHGEVDAPDPLLKDLAAITSELQTEPDKSYVTRLSDVTPVSVGWLWKQRIPLGKVTLVEGDPGVGKSYLTGAISAGVTVGQGLPGEQPTEPRNVLLLTAEDGLDDTVRPRLDKMGADVSRVFALEDLTAFDTAGLLRLEAAIIETQAALVVIDPLIAFMPKTDIHRANEVRAVMAALARIAERQGCAILCVRHLTKSHKGRAIYAGAGSIDFTASCRSVLLVGADPEDSTKRAIVQTKNNLAEFANGLGYTITDDGFFWTGDSDLSADRILSDASSEEARNENRDGERFLREALAEGRRHSKDVQREATTQGISAWALRRARAALGVLVAKEGGHFGDRDQRWMWALPEDVSPAPEDVNTHAISHLQANHEDKKTSGNGLAEDVSPEVCSHLQDDLSQVQGDKMTLLLEWCDRHFGGATVEVCPAHRALRSGDGEQSAV